MYQPHTHPTHSSDSSRRGLAATAVLAAAFPVAVLAASYPLAAAALLAGALAAALGARLAANRLRRLAERRARYRVPGLGLEVALSTAE
ncbi:MAG: hypothetical protein ABEH77_09670 [Halobacteriaceae archaeon]